MTFFGAISAALLIAITFNIGFVTVSHMLADWHLMGLAWAAIAVITIRRYLRGKGYSFEEKGSCIGFACAFLMLIVPGVVPQFLGLSLPEETPFWAKNTFSLLVVLGVVLTAGLGGIAGKKEHEKL